MVSSDWPGECWGRHINGHSDCYKHVKWFRFPKAANWGAWWGSFRLYSCQIFHTVLLPCGYTDSVGDWSSTLCLISWTLVRIFFWCPAKDTPILWRSLENTKRGTDIITRQNVTVHPLSTHLHADVMSGEISYSTKYVWNSTAKQPCMKSPKQLK